MEDLFSLGAASALLQVILVDLVLAGDNAIVVGMASAGLPERQRARVIAIGISLAVVMRIGFALVTVQLLQITGVLLVGGLLLAWVCWKLWQELHAHVDHAKAAASRAVGRLPHEQGGKSMRQAIVQIVIADLSMSLDNVLAVAGVAREHVWVLVFGLVLSVVLMGVAATLVARVLATRPWIGYIGLLVIVYVAGAMIWEGTAELVALLRPL